MKSKTKKFLCTVLAVLMLLGAVPLSDLGFQASATSKTCDEALSWVRSQNGKSLDVDGYPASQPYQCVDFIAKYYEYLGVSRSSGNGCDYATNTLPNGWSRIKGGTPQPGDILVYTGNDSAHKAGHVAIFEASNAIWHQNWGYSYVIKTTNKSYSSLSSALSYWGCIRPNFDGGSGDSFTTNIDNAPSDWATFDKATTSSFNVAGWAFRNNGKHTSVYYCFDDNGYTKLNSVERADVVNVYGNSQLDCGFNQSIDISDLSVGDHTFKIWCSSNGVDHDMYCIGINIICKTTITFNPVGGTAGGTTGDTTFNLEYGQGYYNDVSGLYPAKTGYTFLGWFTDDVAGDLVYDANGIAINDGVHWENNKSIFPFNYAVYAHWSCNHGTTEIKNVKSATCTAEGYTGDTYCKTCGTKIKSGTAVAKLSHKYTSVITTPATHLTEGVETFTCSCGDSYTKPVAKLKGHTYDTVVTAPTCTTKGYTTYTCECGETYIDDYTDMLDHEYKSEITTPATHLTEGVETFTCSCGDSYTKPVAKLKGHTYSTSVTAPTCTAQGYTTYICECGDSYISDFVSETGHKDENNDGICDGCGIKLKTDSNKDNCTCMCHKSGLMGIIWKILRFFYKLFKINPVCTCGAAHY